MNKMNKSIYASKIINWYRRIKLIHVLKRYRNFNYNDYLNLMDYFNFTTGLWDYMGLLSDMNIVDFRENDSEYISNEIYSSDDDFSKDTLIENTIEENNDNQSLFQYAISFFNIFNFTKDNLNILF